MLPLFLNKKIAYIIGGALVVSLVFSFGWWNASNRCEAKKLQAVERAIEQAQEMQAEIDLIENDYIDRNEKVKKIYRIIDREVIKYVKSRDDVQCLDADGVLLWNNANSPNNTTEPSD